MERFDVTTAPGVRWVPPEPSGTGVLVLAGSSGRIDEERARLLAEQGVVAESVQWFGGPGQHEGPWEIPLELFLDRVEDLSRSCSRIVVVGTSFGAEAALLAGTLSPRVDAVVAFAPTDVVWTGVTPEGHATSHWTLAGSPVPHVPYLSDWEPEVGAPAFRELYAGSHGACRAADPDRLEAATIRTEQIRELVLVAGGDDQVWPAVPMAGRIVERRRRHGIHTTVVTLPDAGHRTTLPGETPPAGGMTMRRGGTPRADAELGRLAWPVLLATLRLVTGAPGSGTRR